MIKKLALPLVLLVLAGCGLLPGKGPGTGLAFREVKPMPPLCDSVKVLVNVLNEGRKVASRDTLVLELKLVNTSNNLAVVYNELDLGWLVVIEMIGSNGQYSRSPVPEEKRQGKAGKYHYASLPPGGFVGTRYTIQPADMRWDLTPGKYRVRAVYRNPYALCVASPCFTDDDVKQLGEKAVVPLLVGMIVSNIDEFEVVKK